MRSSNAASDMPPSSGSLKGCTSGQSHRRPCERDFSLLRSPVWDPDESRRWRQTSVDVSPGCLALRAYPNADPMQTQRGCPHVPQPAHQPGVLNSECPFAPLRAPRPLGLEMRYTGSTRIKVSNPSRSVFPYSIRDVDRGHLSADHARRGWLWVPQVRSADDPVRGRSECRCATDELVGSGK